MKVFAALYSMLLLVGILSSCQAPTTSKPNPSDPQYQITSIGPFSDGLARISTSEGYGYINTSGNIIIEPTYNDASEKFNTLSKVREKILIDENAFTFTTKLINKNNEIVYTSTGKEVAIGDFCNGFFWVEVIEKTLSGDIHQMIYYDESGTEKFRINNASNAEKYSSFNNYGYAIVLSGSCHGPLRIIYKDGTSIDFSIKYKDFDDLSGIATATYVGGYYIDYSSHSIELVNQVCLSSIYPFAIGQEYCSLSYQTTEGDWLNRETVDHFDIYEKNNFIIDLYRIAELNQGIILGAGVSSVDGNIYFPIHLRNKDNTIFSAIIDKNGNILMEPTNDIRIGYEYKEESTTYTKRYTTYTFYAGLCKAQDTTTSLYGYIDLQGNWVIQPLYNSVTDFSGEGDDAVAVVNNNTIINRKGEVIFTIASNE